MTLVWDARGWEGDPPHPDTPTGRVREDQAPEVCRQKAPAPQRWGVWAQLPPTPMAASPSRAPGAGPAQ